MACNERMTVVRALRDFRPHRHVVGFAGIPASVVSSSPGSLGIVSPPLAGTAASASLIVAASALFERCDGVVEPPVVKVGAAMALEIAFVACNFRADFQDCRVACTATSGCPSDLTCAASEDWCRTGSATMAGARATLGDTITQWIAANPRCKLVEFAITQSSDSRFHCVTIVLFFVKVQRAPTRGR